MKLQNYTAIFIIIILPIILITSLYISTGLKTIKYQGLYDEGLLSATSDAVFAFEQNTNNSDYSDNPEIKRDIIKASINLFEKSLAKTCDIASYSTKEIEDYVPALVFGMYDGFYMYTPSLIEINGNTEYKHSLKNYVYYSETIIGAGSSGSDVVITYSLDNYITVSGDFGEGYEIKKGYLMQIDPFNTNQSIGKEYAGITIEEETIDNEVNSEGKNYYIRAFEFTHWFLDDSGLANVTIDGTKPFLISGTNDPENETSAFVQHKRKVIREKIEGVLNSTITAYSERTWGQEYKMPKFSEEDWQKIYTNISMISFFQGKEIGLTKYNGYCVVNSTNNTEYVNPNLMYFIDKNTEEYHDIRCSKCGANLTGYRIGNFEKKKTEVETEQLDASGNPIKDAEGNPLTELVEKYDYEHDELACYDCINNMNNSETSVYDYVKSGGSANADIKTAYWTSLGRERYDPERITPIDLVINITFDANEGTLNEEFSFDAYNKTYEYDESIIFPNTTDFTEEQLKSKITKTGYTFDGWSTAKQGGTVINIENQKAIVDTIYYVAWKKNKYPVIFHVNYPNDTTPEGYSDPISKEGEFESSIPIPDENIEIAEVSGWKMEGWSKTDGGDKITNIDQIKVEAFNVGDVNPNTYYGIWTQQKYNITFDYNGGTDGEGKTEKTDSLLSGTTITFPNITKGGYEFICWKDSSGNIVDTTSQKAQGHKTYSAAWGYNITFDFDNGNSQSTYKYEENAIIEFPQNPINEGYIFKGWYDGTEKVEGEKRAIANKTYKAQWEPITVKITLDYNGGIDVSGNSNMILEVPYNTDIVFPEVKKTGYIFKGWSTKLSATSGTLSAVAKGNITYHAIWEIEKYDITFNYNGGKDSENRSQKTEKLEYNTKIEFPEEPTRENYEFIGWNINLAATEGIDTTNIIATEDVTYYAIWDKIECQITFNYNYDSKGTIKTEVVEQGNTIPFPSVVRTGYTLKGWNENASATIGITSATATEDVTYYAIWELNKYQVTFNYNGATDSRGNTSKTISDIPYNTSISSYIPNIIRTGYTLKGWNEDSSATDGIDMTNVKVINNITYYAIWEVNQYKITYYNNHSGSDTTGTEIIKNYGEKIDFSLTPNSRTGYDFVGWSTSRVGAVLTEAQKNSSFVPDNNNTKYYAIWEIATYDITFDYNGGRDASGRTSYTLKDVQHGTSITFPAHPTRNNFYFAGWSTNRTETQNIKNATATNDKTYYAVWLDYVAKNMSTGRTYETLQGAIDELKLVSSENVEIRLYTYINENIEVNNSTTINLNNYTITTVGTLRLINSQITIKNGTINGNIQKTWESGYLDVTGANATFNNIIINGNMNDVKGPTNFNNVTLNGNYTKSSPRDATINNSTITGNIIHNDGNLTLNGGSLNGTIKSSNHLNTLTLNDIKVDAGSMIALEADGADVVIQGQTEIKTGNNTCILLKKGKKMSISSGNIINNSASYPTVRVERNGSAETTLWWTGGTINNNNNSAGYEILSYTEYSTSILGAFRTWWYPTIEKPSGTSAEVREAHS